MGGSDIVGEMEMVLGEVGQTLPSKSDESSDSNQSSERRQ